MKCGIKRHFCDPYGKYYYPVLAVMPDSPPAKLLSICVILAEIIIKYFIDLSVKSPNILSIIVLERVKTDAIERAFRWKALLKHLSTGAKGASHPPCPRGQIHLRFTLGPPGG